MISNKPDDKKTDPLNRGAECMRVHLWCWDARMTWDDEPEGVALEMAVSDKKFPYRKKPESYLQGFQRLVDYCARTGVHSITVWGFLRDSHGGVKAASELCEYAADQGVGILPGVGLCGYGGYYYDGEHQFNLDTYLRKYPERISSADAPQFGHAYSPVLDPSLAANRAWWLDGLEWMLENFKIAGINYEMGDFLVNRSPSAEAARAALGFKADENIMDLVIATRELMDYGYRALPEGVFISNTYHRLQSISGFPELPYIHAMHPDTVWQYRLLETVRREGFPHEFFGMPVHRKYGYLHWFNSATKTTDTDYVAEIARVFPGLAELNFDFVGTYGEISAVDNTLADRNYRAQVAWATNPGLAVEDFSVSTAENCRKKQDNGDKLPSLAGSRQGTGSGGAVSSFEKKTLRDLAKRVSEIAAMPEQETKREAWIAHNRLENRRPLVCCFPEGAWLECVPPKLLKCVHPVLRGWETKLRMIIYMSEEIRDDQPIDAVFNVGWGDVRQTESITGLEKHDHKNNGNALSEDIYFVHPYLELTCRRVTEALNLSTRMQTRCDPDRFVMPEFSIDRQASDKRINLAGELLGDILEVRRRGNSWAVSGGPGGAAGLRGLENLMMDMYDDPLWVHALLRFLCRVHDARLDFMENEGCLTLNNGCEWIGTGGIGYSDELPASGFDPVRVRCRDIWGGIQLQDVSGISPVMFEEFFFPYILPIMERYGLSSYGCCEPVHDWLPLLMKVRNLRRVSVSPWADVKKCAEHMCGNYVFSYKPNPTSISTSRMDERSISKGLETVFTITKEHGCIVQVLMKDLHTIHGKPARVCRWVELVRQAMDKIYG